MVAALSLPTSPSREQRFLLHNVAWRDYVILREALDTPGLRMTYLRGELELMSPSRAHERNKNQQAALEALERAVRTTSARVKPKRRRR